MWEGHSMNALEARVVALDAAGHGAEDIGARLRCSADHVRRILQWSNIHRVRRPGRRYPAAVEARVAQLRAVGESDASIGRRFGRSDGFARRIERLTAMRPASPQRP